ncbi:FGGY family carbohydrate kinase [Erysipelothrix aquatica]|uniref:FGGY family carbohydrate kinase n=1 Tax=Erysipelothrix aquatica TaxID=2683714 RepID=UPI00135AE448|nr:FGGY family carbohydrate kinase [Erysipelothrix aquatica]
MERNIVVLHHELTHSRAVVVNQNKEIVASASVEISPIYSHLHRVELNPEVIWESHMQVIADVLTQGIDIKSIAAIGIANQRETMLVWDKNTGAPIYNAIVSTDDVTSHIFLHRLGKNILKHIYEATGLSPDSLYAASKIKWILDNVPGARLRAEKGELLFGTVDTWLVYKLTHKKVHVTDVTNAAHTMLFNITSLAWDDALLQIFDIPRKMLPDVKNSSGMYGYATIQNTTIPITGIIGNDQAALLGQTFLGSSGSYPYNSGNSLIMNTGSKLIRSNHGLNTTIAMGINNHVNYALEGSTVPDTVVNHWLLQDLGLIQKTDDLEFFATKVEDTLGIYVIPKQTYALRIGNNQPVRGNILGLTRASKREHIIRAALESIAYQSYDIIQGMESDWGGALTTLNVSSKMTNNSFLMQFMANLTGTIIRCIDQDTAIVVGVAFLAGYATGLFGNDQCAQNQTVMNTEWHPEISYETRKVMINGWHEAVVRSMGITRRSQGATEHDSVAL